MCIRLHIMSMAYVRTLDSTDLKCGQRCEPSGQANVWAGPTARSCRFWGWESVGSVLVWACVRGEQDTRAARDGMA